MVHLGGTQGTSSKFLHTNEGLVGKHNPLNSGIVTPRIPFMVSCSLGRLEKWQSESDPMLMFPWMFSWAARKMKSPPGISLRGLVRVGDFHADHAHHHEHRPDHLHHHRLPAADRDAQDRATKKHTYFASFEGYPCLPWVEGNSLKENHPFWATPMF